MKTATRHMDLMVDTQAARLARRFVTETLLNWDCEHLVDEMTLAVSELVTNSIVHAKSNVGITIVDLDDSIHVRVKDSYNKAPVKRIAGPHDTGGRGIYLVENIADDWGIDPDPPGKVVWLELAKY